jgi:hypothetical protein
VHAHGDAAGQTAQARAGSPPGACCRMRHGASRATRTRGRPSFSRVPWPRVREAP